MLLTCPTCHACYTLDAAVQDEAARELLSLSGQAGRIWPVLIKYLTLFRPKTRKLAWDRTLKLAQEALALSSDPAVLETALIETFEALRAKGGEPLKNHNYLKRVLENTTPQPPPYTSEGGGALGSPPVLGGAGGGKVPTSKTASAIGRLENWK